MGQFKIEGYRKVDEMGKESGQIQESGASLLEASEQIDSLLESIHVQDDSDLETVHTAESGYKSSAEGSFEQNVETGRRNVEQTGSEVQSEMGQEMENVNEGRETMEQAASVTEVGREHGTEAAGALSESAEEYRQIIEQAGMTEDELDQQVEACQNRLDSLF